MRKIQHKQIFRLWFEFYRLCLLSEDKEIKSSVKKTLNFYEPWNLNQLSQSDLNKADSSTRCNKDEPGNGWLRMPRHHGRLNRQVQVARCTSTSAEKNDTKFTAS